jgi:hypothetical protein
MVSIIGEIISFASVSKKLKDIEVLFKNIHEIISQDGLLLFDFLILTIFAFAVLVIIYLYMIKPIILRIRTNRSKRRTHVNLESVVPDESIPLELISSSPEELVVPIGIVSRIRNVTAYLDAVNNSKV